MWQLIQAGWNLIKGLWEGISQGASWLWGKITGWLDSLWGGIKNFFGIHSPSTEMAWIGEMLTEGLAGGIEDNAAKTVQAAEEMASDILNAVSGLDSTVDVGMNTAFASGTASVMGTEAVDAGILNILEKYLPELVNREVTIDGDTIVGKLAPKYNKQFGRMETLAARGV